MTPQPFLPAARRPFGLGAFSSGLAVGALASFILSAGLGVAVFRHHLRSDQKGMALVPVIVATRDLEAGGLVTTEGIAQRLLHVACVTPSMLRPDSAARVLNHKVLVPLKAGDEVLWSEVEAAPAPP